VQHTKKMLVILGFCPVFSQQSLLAAHNLIISFRRAFATSINNTPFINAQMRKKLAFLARRTRRARAASMEDQYEKGSAPNCSAP